MTDTTARPGRPALERFRFDLRIAIEIGAENYDDADARVAAIEADLRPKLERMVRNHRKGRPELVTLDVITDSVSAV